jgi:polyisoprenoid-binding protein YceI
MKKHTFSAVIAITTIFLSFTVVKDTTWSYDNNHAKVGFIVTHMMVSDVEGYFKKATATLVTTKDDFTDAVVEMNADAASIFTDNEMRDKDLQSEKFFDVAKYPSVTFKSSSFKKAKAANTYIVKGNLSMHGITKPITLTAIARTATNPMNKKTVAGFKITGQVNRFDFGIGSNAPTAIISNEVQLNVNVEFIKN